MVASRARRRRGEGAQLRDEILDAVNKLLAEWGGVERLTIRAVAAEVGIAAPSVYLHFRDKADLVWSALDDKYRQLAREMSSADRAEQSRDALCRLRAQSHAYCRFGLENPGHYRLMFETTQPHVEDARIRLHPASLVSGGLREGVSRCKNEGYLLALPAEQTAHTLWAGMHGALSLSHSLFAVPSLASLALSLTDGLLDSLVAAPGAGFPDRSGETDGEASKQIRAVLDGTYRSDAAE